MIIAGSVDYVKQKGLPICHSGLAPESRMYEAGTVFLDSRKSGNDRE